MIDPFDLNLRHLRAVPQIVRRATMSAAAEAAGLSQPALTQGIAKLERQVGQRLFVRRSDGMDATAEAGRLAIRIDAAFAHLAAAVRTGRGYARPERLMTATQLRAYLALADAGSFADAARATGWSQPALHRAVRELEQLSPVPLVERRGRGVMLTTEGRRLARGIRLARAEIAGGLAELTPDARLRGRLVVGAMPLSRALLLPAAIAALIREAPAATVDVVEGSWRELVEPLRDGVIDLMVGALRDPPGPLGLDQQPLFDDALAVVARAGHPLAGGDVPTRGALAAYPWIVGSAGTPLREHWQAMFADAPPPAPVECGSVMTIRGILLESDCLTLLSPDQIAMEVQAGLLATIGPPRADRSRTIGITTRSEWHPPRLAERFVQLLHVHAAER